MNTAVSEGEISEAIAANLGNTARMVLGYLGEGMTQAAAADAAGCSASYVSQLMEQPEFRALVAQARAVKYSKYAEMDRRADDLQLTALTRLEKVIAMEHKLPNLLRAVQVLDGMKRRSTAATDEAGAVAATVKITLPSAVRANYTVAVDMNNKVVQIGESNLIPATGAIIDGMAKIRKEAQRESLNNGTESGGTSSQAQQAVSDL